MQKEKSFRFSDKNNTAGVVVLFNPERNVVENILSYLDQIKFLYIVDNSEKSASYITGFISENENKLEYIFNGENLGVAAALNIGAQKAVNAGYSFLLTMDQDSKVPSGMVESLIEAAQKHDDTGIVSPLHANKYGTHIKQDMPDFSEVVSVMTSGNLLSLDAYKTVGGFLEDFFIDYIDIEYCIRLIHNNYKVIRLNNLVMQHNEADLSEKKFFFVRYYPQNHAPFRIYYKTRNLLLLRKICKTVYMFPLKREYGLYFRTLIKIILFEKHKFLKSKMAVLGMLDYFKGRKGKKF